MVKYVQSIMLITKDKEVCECSIISFCVCVLSSLSSCYGLSCNCFFVALQMDNAEGNLLLLQNCIKSILKYMVFQLIAWHANGSKLACLVHLAHAHTLPHAGREWKKQLQCSQAQKLYPIRYTDEDCVKLICKCMVSHVNVQHAFG